MQKYIAFDTETGGLRAKQCSLLTVYFVVLDNDLKTVLGELDLKIKPNAGEPYSVTSEALAVNKINLIDHDKEAITESEASQRLYKFLNTINPDGQDKLVPVGHNEYFDEEFIKERLLASHNWSKFISYRRLDTGTVAEFLKVAGLMPRTVGSGLGKLCEYFDINFPDAHTAKGDTMATVKLLRKMLALAKKGDNGRNS
jgi:DNA polymerase III alpha subunit (gram-positive type)